MTDEWYEDEHCIECGELISDTDYPEDSEYVGDYESGSTYEQTRVGGETGYWCLYCRERFDSAHNTLVLLDDEGAKTKVEYSDGIMFDHSQFGTDSVDNSVPDNSYESVILAIVAGTSWKSTDAWRGYEHGPSDADEWVKVKDTWHGSMTATSASERVNDLAEGLGPLPVAVAFTTTSNVMSTGIEVYAPEDRIEAIEAFFDGAAAGLDGGRF